MGTQRMAIIVQIRMRCMGGRLSFLFVEAVGNAIYQASIDDLCWQLPA
jgi:hypothetical protein